MHLRSSLQIGVHFTAKGCSHVYVLFDVYILFYVADTYIYVFHVQRCTDLSVKLPRMNSNVTIYTLMLTVYQLKVRKIFNNCKGTR